MRCERELLLLFGACAASLGWPVAQPAGASRSNLRSAYGEAHAVHNRCDVPFSLAPSLQLSNNAASLTSGNAVPQHLLSFLNCVNTSPLLLPLPGR